MGNNKTYRGRALNSLEGKWSKAVIATLIYLAISMGVNWTITAPMGNNWVMSYSTEFIWTLLCLPLGWGFSIYFLNLIREDDISYGRLFDGYKDFLRIFIAGLLMFLIYIILLGCPALIIVILFDKTPMFWYSAIFIIFIIIYIPIIIFSAIISLMLSQTFFILKDNSNISAIDAMIKSGAMMKGHKEDLFFLYLSFTGWFILCILTFGIGILFLYPFVEATQAHFYEDLKAEAEKPGMAEII